MTGPDGITVVQNVGHAIHRGAEAAVQVDPILLYDDRVGSDYATRWGSVTLYANAMFLHARFVSGDVDGKTPQYAPDFLVRAGGIYHWGDRVKVALLGTYVDNEYGNDNNSRTPENNYFIPAYSVCDLTLQARVYRSVSVMAGINNLFDDGYYARIRSEGIDPAYRRNYYGGVSVAF